MEELNVRATQPKIGLAIQMVVLWTANMDHGQDGTYAV